MAERIENTRRIWNEHIARMDDNSQTKRVLNYLPMNGMKGTTLTWTKGIKAIIKFVGIGEENWRVERTWREVAQNCGILLQ